MARGRDGPPDNMFKQSPTKKWVFHGVSCWFSRKKNENMSQRTGFRVWFWPRGWVDPGISTGEEHLRGVSLLFLESFREEMMIPGMDRYGMTIYEVSWTNMIILNNTIIIRYPYISEIWWSLMKSALCDYQRVSIILLEESLPSNVKHHPSWWMWFIDETKELALLKTEKLEACGIHSFGFSQAVAGFDLGELKWSGWVIVTSLWNNLASWWAILRGSILTNRITCNSLISA